MKHSVSALKNATQSRTYFTVSIDGEVFTVDELSDVSALLKETMLGDGVIFIVEKVLPRSVSIVRRDAVENLVGEQADKLLKIADALHVDALDLAESLVEASNETD